MSRRWLRLRSAVGVLVPVAALAALVAAVAVPSAGDREERATTSSPSLEMTVGARPVPGAPPPAPDVPLALSVAGTNGVARETLDGPPCTDPGTAQTVGVVESSWRVLYEDDLAPGTVSNLPGVVRLAVDLHNVSRLRPDRSLEPFAPDANAFLGATESRATIGNERGTLALRLESGSCLDRTVAFDGVQASGGGEWTVESGTGSYVGAAGSGFFELAAGVAPGADNPFTLEVYGGLGVLRPNLAAEVVETYWGHEGIDYLTRLVSVVVEVRNEGPGDAYDLRLVEATTPTHRVKAKGPAPQDLGHLLAGDARRVVVRYRLPVASGDPPCGFVIFECELDATLVIEAADALDVVAAHELTAHAIAPDLPPPVEELLP